MKITKILILILLFNLVGCASLKELTVSEANDLKLYQIYVDKDGALIDPNTGEPIHNEKRYVNNIFNNYKNKKEKNSKLKLTVFIHGGLNTLESATTRVRRVKDRILKDEKYPIFVSWNSGAFTNYYDHLFEIRDGEREVTLGLLSSPFVFLEDALRSVARIPATTYHSLLGKSSIVLSKYSEEADASDATLDELIKDDKFKIYLKQDESEREEIMNVYADWWSFWNPFKLLTAPFIDGLGTGTWDSMLRRTDLVLRKQDGFNGKINADTAVSQFFKKIETSASKDEINLIGHSMGTIIANNIIVRHPGLNISNIVYMAGACRVKDLEYVVAPYLEAHQKTKFYNLSLDAYRDSTENTYYDFAPRGSLLMWIDQTFGDINSFQDRTAGYWPNITRGVNEAFNHEHIKKRVHLTRFGIDDDGPQKHGDFSDYNFWNEKFWTAEVVVHN